MTSKGNFFVLYLKLDESEIGEWMATFFVQGWAMHLRNTMVVVVGGAVVLTKNATSVYRSSVPLLSLDLLSFDTTVSRPMPTLCSFV